MFYGDRVIETHVMMITMPLRVLLYGYIKSNK